MDDRGEIIIYQTEDGLTKIDVSMQDETVWLTQEHKFEQTFILPDGNEIKTGNE